MQLGKFSSWALRAIALAALGAACAAPDDAPAEVGDGGAPGTEARPAEVAAPSGAPTSSSKAPAKTPDEASAPEAYSVVPDRAVVGSMGPTIVVSGNNFVARSVLQLDGAPLATTYVSATELRATLPTGRLAAVGVLRVSVGTAPPGGGASKELTFQVENPVAELSALSPLSVVTGAPATTLTVKGAGFVPGAVISFDKTALVTTFASATELSATLAENVLATSGSFAVRVTNPPPGGGASQSIAFTVTNPNVVVTQVQPQVATAGAGPVDVTVLGAGFLATTSVLFNGTKVASAFVSSQELTATVPSSLLATVGELPVTVSNPPPGGGVSAPVVFRVQYPSPVASSLSPTTATLGQSPQVTVTGSGYYPSSQVTFDGAPAVTTFVDGSRVRATLPSSMTDSAKVIAVRVVNPMPGGGSSQGLSLTVQNPSPSITTVTPGSVVAGADDTTVTVNGSGFVATSVVRSNGFTLPTAFVSATRLSAIVPKSQLATPQLLALTVTNPAPGGGTSAARTFMVECATDGVDVRLGALGTVTALPTDFANATTVPRFSSAGLCATATLSTTNTQPARSWIVQNTTLSPVTLSAWGDCTTDAKSYDSYLTFYRRPTAPLTDDERLACAERIAEGSSGAGGYASPESGTSKWCPGLTKANGGGITLAACERAIVHVQAWSATSTYFPPVERIKVKPE